MTPRRSLAPAAVVAALALAGASTSTALRAQGRPLASAPYPADALSASASAALREPLAASVSGHRRWVPAPDVAPIPDERSAAPTRDEWKNAPEAREARVTEPGCRVLRLREWYRIECEHIAMQLVGGTRDELEFGEFYERRDDAAPRRVWAIFPARRGAVRFFQVYRWGKWSPEPDAHASVQWLDGDALPLLTVQGHRWGI